MKTVLIFLCLAASASAWAKSEAPAGDSGRRPPFILSARAGFLFSNIDSEVDSQWDHEIWKSHALQVGIAYSVPQAWRQVYFYFGPEIARFSSTESIEGGGGRSEIKTTMTQLLFKSGAMFQPDFLGGNWGAIVITGIEAWGELESRLTTSSIDRSLGRDKTEMPLVLGVGAFYQITPHIKPVASIETRVNGFTHFALGVNFGF